MVKGALCSFYFWRKRKMVPNKILNKKGYVYFRDSQNITYEKKITEHGGFNQIKIHINDLTARCSTNLILENGYRSEPLQLDYDMVKAIISIMNELKKEKDNEN